MILMKPPRILSESLLRSISAIIVKEFVELQSKDKILIERSDSSECEGYDM